MTTSGAGGVPPLNVQIRITTTGARGAANSMRQVTNASKSMTRGFDAGIITTRTLGDAMRQSASLMKYTVAGVFVRLGKSAIQASRDFELSFSKIRGLIGISADAVERMKKGLLDMAVSTTKAPQELAEALFFITSAGIRDSTAAMQVLERSAKASAAGLGETKVVADAVTSALNAYGQETLSAAKATDVIASAVRYGKVEADTMAPAFSKVLPIAAAFGTSFEDVAASMAALSRSGMSAGTAAIYTRQVMSQLLKPSKQARDALASVGTSAADIRKQVQEEGLLAALKTLSERIGGIQNAESFARVFGNVRALTAVLQLVGPAVETNTEIFERLNNATGDLDDSFNAYAETLDARFARAQSAAGVAMIQLGDSLKPLAIIVLEVSKFISQMASAIMTFKVAGVPVFAIVAGMTAALVTFVAVTAGVMKTVSSLIRLTSNLQITLRGTTYMYDATTGSVYRYTGATAAAGKATATATAHMRAATLTAKGWTVANNTLGKSLLFVQKAGGKVFLALTAISLAIGIFSAIRGGGDKASKSLKGLTGQVAGLNDMLDESVKYKETNIKFGVTIAVNEAKITSDALRLREQIVEQSPDFFTEIKDIVSTQDADAAAAYIGTLMQAQFGGVSDSVKSALKELFELEMGLTDDSAKAEFWAKTIVPDVTGDALTDALITQAVIAARDSGDKAVKAISGTGFSDFAEALAQDIRTTGPGTGTLKSLGGAVNEFGRAFQASLKRSGGSLGPFLAAMQELETRGLASSEVVVQSFSGLFEGLEGELQLKNAGKGLRNIFLQKENLTPLTTMIQKTIGGSAEQAKNIVTTIRDDLESVDMFDDAAQWRVLSEALGKYKVAAEKAQNPTDDMVESLRANRDALRETIEEYEKGEKAIKDYEKAQRGLMGMNLTIEQQTLDTYEAFRKLNKSAREGKGDFRQNTEAGAENREAIRKAAQEVFALGNAYVEAGDAKKGGLVVSQGLAKIVEAAEAGSAGAGVRAANLLDELGFTGETFVKGIMAAQEEVDETTVTTGKNIIAGINQGLEIAAPSMSATLVNALKSVVVTSQKALEIGSPSKVMAKQVGKPMAEGVGVGFSKETKSARFKGALAKDLDAALTKVYKTGSRKSISKYLSDFLEKKKNVETPAQDFVKATISRMKDIIGSLGGYIKSQLNFRAAQADLAKLINMQKGLDDRRKKAAREQQYAETRLGRGGGAEVTGYEQAQIDELQLAFERVSRDYAMGRATYMDLVDAEIALYEARAAASEISNEVIDAQNEFIDATVAVENRSLELAAATVGVLEAYQDVQEAAAELYMNHKELAGVYDTLAKATGIASGKIVIGTKDMSALGGEVSSLGGFASTVGGYVSTLGNNIGLTGDAFKAQFEGDDGIFKTLTKTGTNVNSLTKSIGADFVDLSRGLLNKDSEMYRNLQSLGPNIFKTIQLGAQEALDKSPLNLKIDVNAVVSKGGSGSVSWNVSGFDFPDTKIPKEASSGVYKPGIDGYWVSGAVTKSGKAEFVPTPGKAVGGPVSMNTPYIVGERGPEMFVPKVSGTIVTASALERYTRTRGVSSSGDASQKNNIVVTVNNPVPEAAQDSITRRMKVLANSGLFG